MSVRTVSVRLLAEIAGYIGPLKAAARVTNDFRNELSKAASAGKLDALASTATRAGLALAGGFASVSFAAARFEKQMSAVEAVSNASAAEMAQLGEAAIQAGKDTAFSATEAAKAEEELLKAGISAADVLGGALTGALSLAAAGSLDLAEAADVAAKAMNIFDLSGKDVGHVADVLAAAANKSATDVHELGFAMKMSGLAAKQSGLSLEDTAGTLAAFADNALNGSDAGTSLKTMLMHLAAPSEKSAGLMEELGISAFNAQGEFVGISRLAGILQERLGDLTQEQRNQALATIFGSDAMRAAAVLYDEGDAGIRSYINAVDDQGAAQEAARIKTDNLMGDVERLTGSLETLAIQAGSGTNEGLRFLAQTAGHLVDQLGNIPGPVQTVGVGLAGLGGVSLLALSGFIKMREKSQELADAFKEMGPAGERAGRALNTTTKWAGRAAIAFGALQIAGLAVNAIYGDLNPQLDAAAQGLRQWSEGAGLSGESARIFGKDAEDLTLALQELSLKGFDKGALATVDFAGNLMGIQSKLGDAKEKVAAFDQALRMLVESGEEAQALKHLEFQAAAAGISVEELKSKLPGYTAAMELAGTKTGEAGKDMEGTAGKAGVLGGAIEAAEAHVDAFITKWEELHGVEKSADEAMLDAMEAIDSLGDTFEENGPKIDGVSRAATENRVALRGAAAEAVAAAQRYFDLTGDAKGAADIMDDFRQKAIDQTGATGKAKDAVKALADELFKLPPQTTVNVTANVNTNIKISAAHIRARVNREIERLQGFDAFRWGGIREARVGLLSDASIFGATPGGLIKMAEAATQGEAFIPKVGNTARSMSILDTAAGWYGAQVVPKGGTMMGGRAGGGIDYKALADAVVAAARAQTDGATILATVSIGGERIAEMVEAKVEQVNDRTALAVSGGPRP